MSEGLRGALNAILFRTGDQSRDFTVVLATNRPGALQRDADAAVDGHAARRRATETDVRERPNAGACIGMTASQQWR
jgi:hypothetical protein